jgi:hypothetical protein
VRVVEQMRRFETPWHVVRLWLGLDAEDADRVARAARDYARDGPLGAQQVAEGLAHVVRGLNAVEVVDRGTGNGTVIYPDWP